MCMLLLKPAFYTLPDDYLNSLWDNNPHGLSAINTETNEIFKTMNKIEAIDYLKAEYESELIVHFRFSTSGAKTLDQLHCFDVGNGLYLFHNGILNSFKGDNFESDTQKLAKHFKGKTLIEMVQYLEIHEQNSRFIIYDAKSKEIHQPDCALWHDHVMPDGQAICFSNTYAIDTDLLFPDYENIGKDGYFELEYLIFDVDNTKLVELGDYIANNPDLVAKYLRDYLGA